MTEIMTEKLWEALEKLAESTGVAVEKLYVVLEQQAKVQMVYDVLLLLGVVILLIIGGVAIKKLHKKAEEDMYGDWDVLFIIITAVTSVFGGVAVFAIIPELIKEIVQIMVNPPVWILEYVMNLIK